ncbi:hypothetical protein FQN57_004962 [Myotisia sp. PD_48]|nr:hypothetical protein FQN57_004962 [Myotisia sp. PD_48]
MKKPALSSEMISDSESSGLASIPERKQVKKSAKVSKSKTLPEKTKKSRLSSSSSSESSSESGSESEPTSPRIQPGKRVTIQEEHTVNILPAKAFKPPQGFQFVQKSTAFSTELLDLFSDLDGKKLWHITAPSSVPISSIEHLAMESVAKGEPILTYNGNSYKLREDQLEGKKSKSLLVPHKHGNTYRRQRHPISQTYHLEQVVHLPAETIPAQHDPSNGIPSLARPLPKQPKHLKMRYKPFGSSNESPESFGLSSGSEMEDIVFQMPPDDSHASISRGRKKRKHENPDRSTESDSDSGEKLASLKQKQKSKHLPPSASKKAELNLTQRGKTEKQRDPEHRKKDKKRHQLST